MRHAVLWIFVIAAVAACRSGDSPAHPPTRDPDKARALHEVAVLQLDQGDLSAAEAVLKRALAADPLHGPSYNNLGLIYLEQGRLYLAAWQFQRAMELMPQQVQPRNNLGLVLEEARKLDEAVETYREALALQPNQPEVLGNLARARLRRGDDDPELLDQLQQSSLQHPDPTWRAWAQRQSVLLSTTPPAPTTQPAEEL